MSGVERRGAHTPGSIIVPAAAKYLGGLGLIPFVTLALTIPALDDSIKTRAIFALSAYGAVILSFLGGIRWGLAIVGQGNSSARPTELGQQLLLAVTPSLLAWLSLLLPPTPALLMLAATFSWMLWSDLRVTERGVAPAWYPRLRWPLTAIVVCALLVATLV